MKKFVQYLPAPVALVAGVVVLFSACSSNSSAPSNAPVTSTANPGSSVQSADASYVHQICSALGTFENAAQSAVASRSPGAGPATGGNARAALEPLAQDLLKSLQSATPPAELKDFHQSVVQQVTNVVDAITQGAPRAGGAVPSRSPRPGFAPQQRGTPPAGSTPRAGSRRFGGLLGNLQLPDPPAEARAGLSQALAADADCQSVGLSLTSGGN